MMILLLLMMKKYYIKDFQEEHKTILAALNNLERDIGNISDNKDMLEIIRKFFDENFSYVQNHIANENKLYEYLERQLDDQVKLDVLVTSKTVITEEIKKLKNITLGEDAQKNTSNNKGIYRVNKREDISRRGISFLYCWIVLF